jgi:hypothetical protein
VQIKTIELDSLSDEQALKLETAISESWQFAILAPKYSSTNDSLPIFTIRLRAYLKKSPFTSLVIGSRFFF